MRLSIEGFGQVLPGFYFVYSKGISQLFRYEIGVVHRMPVHGIVAAMLTS